MRNRVKEQIFIGTVEDNADPKKMGRCKVRVHTIYDNIPTEDIPWASPFKDLNGNEYKTIEIGKIVYLPIGKCIVSKIWNDYRIAGEFEFWHWEDIDDKWYGTKYKQNLSGHEVSKFNIEGSDEVFVWEDWYYHQSFLYINLYQ